MDKITLTKIKDYAEKLKTIKYDLVSEYQEGYLGKKVYRVTLADGSSRICERITKNKGKGDASLILPITADGKFVMVVQSRPNTLANVELEFPAGMVDPGENFQDAAKRELLEETGYEAEDIYELCKHYQDEGCSSAEITIFLATGCKKVQDIRLDGSERLEYIELSYEDILELMKKETDLPVKINGANSKIAIMTYMLKKEGLM